MMSRLPRDIQCGMDVGRMAELGKFDKEFTVYGCAYWQNGEAYYPLSNKAESIYRFCEAGRLPNILTTAVMSYTVTTSVPSGTCDDIWQTVQWQLARKLAAEYADGYLELLSQLAAAAATDAAWPILQHVQQLLEGRFQRDQLTLFARLAEDCLAAKYLTTAAYQQLQQWLAFNWRQMEDDVLLKDSHGRTLHGFAYRQSGQIRYHYDAQYAVIYHKRQQLSAQGVLTTPICSHTYWFSAFSQFTAIKKQFAALLSELLPPCLTLLETIYQLPPAISPEHFVQMEQMVQQNYGPLAAADLKRHGQRWRCLPLSPKIP